jgi:hypothetical protein
MTYLQRIRSILKRAVEEGPSEMLYIELMAALEAYEPSLDIRSKLEKIWLTEVDDGKLLKRNKGVTVFDIHSIRPQLRDELERRILFSASLIRQNKKKAVETTLQRFNGWMSSLPAVKSVREETDYSDEAKQIAKPLKQLPFDERRVAIDQSHKLVANLNQIVAYDCGAIGAYWHSHWREMNYDYRQAHKELDQKFFLIKDSPAMIDGLVKKGGHEYLEDLPDQPGEPVFCRCYFEYVYRLNRVPEECLTEKGKDAIRK